MRAKRFCTICGTQAADDMSNFPTETSLRCNDCTEVAEARMKLYKSAYQRARYKATKALIVAHQDEYDRLLEGEMDGLRDRWDSAEAVEKELGRPVLQYVSDDELLASAKAVDDEVVEAAEVTA